MARDRVFETVCSKKALFFFFLEPRYKLCGCKELMRSCEAEPRPGTLLSTSLRYSLLLEAGRGGMIKLEVLEVSVLRTFVDILG